MYEPLEHALGSLEPPGHHDPAGQAPQSCWPDQPIVEGGLHVPGSHEKGMSELLPSRQKEPAPQALHALLPNRS